MGSFVNINLLRNFHEMNVYEPLLFYGILDNQIIFAQDIEVVDQRENGGYPTPLEVSETMKTYVGRIRDDISCDNGLALWCVADQLWKGAALNAVQIAELLVRGE